jgi:hypothetical protein
MAEKIYPGQRPPDWKPPEGSAKGGFRWYHAALIVLGVIVVGTLATPPPDPAKEDAAKVSAAAHVPQERQITSVQLAQAYDANEVSAQQFASAGPLQVTGRIEAIELDFSDDPVVRLQGKDDFSHVSVYFDESASDATAALSKGERLTVVCSEISEVIGYPQLKNCVLPPPEAAE